MELLSILPINCCYHLFVDGWVLISNQSIPNGRAREPVGDYPIIAGCIGIVDYVQSFIDRKLRIEGAVWQGGKILVVPIVEN